MCSNTKATQKQHKSPFPRSLLFQILVWEAVLSTSKWLNPALESGREMILAAISRWHTTLYSTCFCPGCVATVNQTQIKISDLRQSPMRARSNRLGMSFLNAAYFTQRRWAPTNVRCADERWTAYFLKQKQTNMHPNTQIQQNLPRQCEHFLMWPEHFQYCLHI